MAKRTFLPRADADKVLWLKNFANKLPLYKVKYGITDAEVADMQNGALVYDYWYNYTNQFKEYVQKLTAYRNELRDGVPSGALASVPPTPPVLGAAPAGSTAGIFVRVSSHVNTIKGRTVYSVPDGKDMGLEGAELAVLERASAKPTITLRPASGGHPEILWQKGGMDAIDIYVKRNDGDEWQFLATDTIPNYTDTFALPASGQSALWKYKVIYRKDDEPAGQWSNEVSISVAGM